MSSITLSDTRAVRPGDSPPKLVISLAVTVATVRQIPVVKFHVGGAPIRSQGPAKVTNGKARPPRAKSCDRCVWTRWRGVPGSPRDGLVSRAAMAIGPAITRGSLLVGDLLIVKATD
jgi:hypothetical protein